MSPAPFKFRPGLLVPVSLIYAVGLLVSSCIIPCLCMAMDPIAVPELWTDCMVWPQTCLVTCLETGGLDLRKSSIKWFVLPSQMTPCLASNVVMDFCFNFQVWGKHTFLGAWERATYENSIRSQKWLAIKSSLDHSTLSWAGGQNALPWEMHQSHQIFL